MFDKLQTLEIRYDELMAMLATSGMQADAKQYQTHSKALAEIQPLVEKFREYKACLLYTSDAADE